MVVFEAFYLPANAGVAMPLNYFMIVHDGKTGSSAALERVLQQLDNWCRFIPNGWVVATPETMEELWKRLRPFFANGSGSVLIVDMPPVQARCGWLDKKIWDWFEQTSRQHPEPAPSPRPSKAAWPVTTTKPLPESSSSPAAPPSPGVSASTGVKCDFCGRESLQSAWLNGDCPVCGIHKSS